MAEIVRNGGSNGKRRLPVWMQGPHDDDGSGSHRGKAKRKPPVTVQSQNGSAQYAIERTAGVSESSSIISIPQELELSEETNRTRRPRTREEKCSKNVSSGREARSTKKAKREISQLGRVVHDENSPETGARKGKRSKKSKEQTPSTVELTVEDLQSIAREYVSAAAYPEASVTSEQPVPNALPFYSSKAFENEREERRAVGSSLKRCSSSVPLSGRALMEEAEVHVAGNQDFSSGIAGTGDAAQDILKLFLGPLLRKPPASKQDSEQPGIDIAAVARQPDGDVRSVAPPPFKIEANLEKKKSSLKDKVSMFLE